MNNEQQRIIDEAYENYTKEYKKDNSIGMCLLVARVDGKSTYRKLHKEMFEGLIRADKTFSEKWGLKIEERELSLDERNQWFHINWNGRNLLGKSDWKDYELNQQNVPTKLITITYKDIKIESYES